MPSDLATEACREYLDSREEKRPSTASIIELLEVVQDSNYFEFGEQLFKQKAGTAIGQKQAPPYCCIGAAKLEKDKIYPNERFLKVVNDTSDDNPTTRWWKHFIDDVFAATTMTEEEAGDFVAWMNTLWPGIHFTYEFSNSNVNYLDIKIIREGNTIKTDLHIKETNKQLYLDYRSCHPAHTFKSIVYSQAMRIKMICSEDEYVQRQLGNLKEKLIDRNYPVDLITQQFEKAMALERADLLRPRTYPHGASLVLPPTARRKLVTPFIFTYSFVRPPVEKWLAEEFHLLQMTEKK